MIISAKTLVTGDGTTILADSAVLIDSEGKIRKIAPKQQLLAKHPGEECLDFGDATILPGLIDMHVHLSSYVHLPDALRHNDHLIAYQALHSAQMALTVGVTTVRDMFGEHLVCEQLRYAATKGYFALPRIFHCDRGITMSGGHANQSYHIRPECEVADGEVEIIKAIRRQLRDGADWVKVMSSHRSLTKPEYSQEELNTAAREAHRLESKAAIHAGAGPSIAMGIEAGFDTIEHGNYLTVEQATEMEKRGLAWVPTMIAYSYAYSAYKDDDGNPREGIPAAVRNFWPFFRGAANAYRENFKKIYDTGVTIAAGTDMVMAGSPPTPVAQELGLMVEYGISPVHAIRAATYNAARILGVENITGQIKEGLEADILVCADNAAQDIHNLEKVKKVFVRGKVAYENG